MNEKREFAKWWLWVLFLIVIAGIVLGTTGQIGRIVDVLIQRQIFEKSFQYDQARKDEVATYKAQIAELEGKLSNPDLSEGTRAEINAQLSAIRIQLNAAQQSQNNAK